MSTAVYRSEQRVFCGGESEPPRVFYGWHIFGSATAVDIHPFETRAQQDTFVENVAASLPPDHTTHPDDVAAFLAVVAGRDADDGDRAWIETLLSDAVPGDDELEELQELAERYLEEAVWKPGAPAAAPELDVGGQGEARGVPTWDELYEAQDAANREALTDALDEAVHELKAQEAAGINNRGLEAQISYLGEPQAREILEALGRERTTAAATGMARLAQNPPLKASLGPER